MIFTTEPKKFLLHNNTCIIQTQNNLICLDANHKIINKRDSKFTAISTNNNLFYYTINSKTYECDDLFTTNHTQIDTTNHPNIIEIYKSNVIHYIYQIDDYICITNIENTLLLHKTTPYYFENHLFFYYKNSFIVEYDTTKNTQRQLCLVKSCTTFTVKNNILAYSEHSRVYLFNLDTKTKKEYHCHNFDVTKLVIDDYNIYSACKQKIVSYEIYSEKKNYICNIKNFVDMKIDECNLYVLTQNEFTVYERGSNKIVNKAIFLDKRSIYRGRLTTSNTSASDEVECNELEKIDDKANKDTNENKIKSDVTDIFEKTKIKNYKKIEIETYADNIESTNKENSTLVFEIKKSMYFIDSKFTKILKIYKGNDNFYKGFVSNNFLIIIKKTKAKQCKIILYKDFVLFNEYKFSCSEISNLQSVIVGDLLYFLSKKHLYICNKNGRFVEIIKNVKFVGQVCNKVFYIKNKQIMSIVENENVQNNKKCANGIVDDNADTKTVSNNYIDENQQFTNNKKIEGEVESTSSIQKITQNCKNNEKTYAKNLKISKFYEYKNKMYFLTKKGLESYDFDKQKIEKKGNFVDFYIESDIYLILVKMNKSFVIKNDTEEIMKDNIKQIITNGLIKDLYGDYVIENI
ncbi:hypothetical protein BDAP_000084 [Binucleata daphniae]